MRRLVLTVATVSMLSVAVSATASGGTEHIKDKFVSISWGGSDGSLPWSGPWSETGDDDDETKGNVRVVSSGNCASGNCLRLSALTTLTGAIGVMRTADTSDLAETTLSFDLETTESLLGSQLVVQVSDGEGWVTVAEYEWGSALDDDPTIDVSEFRSEAFGVRFMFTGALLAGEAFVDNVEITGTLVEETTTTTTAPATTTSTSAPPTPATSAPTTTTTQPAAAPTTSRPESVGSTTSTTSTTVAVTAVTSTTTPGGSGPERDSDVPVASTAATSAGEVGTEPVPEDDGARPDRSGIRAAALGLQANFQGGVYGEVRTVSDLNRVDFQANYNMAVEIIEASWGWMILLGLLVAHSIISGLDRRGSDLDSRVRNGRSTSGFSGSGFP